MAEKYRDIQKEIKFLINSDNRMKILECLYESPQSLKSLLKLTNLSNSSISINLSKLQERGHVFVKNDIIIMSNKCKILLTSIFNLNDTFNLLSEHADFINSHKIEKYYFNGLKNLPMIGNCDLVKSSQIDAFKIFSIFKEFSWGLEFVNIIIHFMPPQFAEFIDYWVENDIKVNLIFDSELFEVFIDMMKEKGYDECLGKNICPMRINKEICFASIVSDKGVVIGSYRGDGKFDQNAVYTSTKKDAILWAINVFEDYANFCEE